MDAWKKMKIVDQAMGMTFKEFERAYYDADEKATDEMIKDAWKRGDTDVDEHLSAEEFIRLFIMKSSE